MVFTGLTAWSVQQQASGRGTLRAVAPMSLSDDSRDVQSASVVKKGPPRTMVLLVEEGTLALSSKLARSGGLLYGWSTNTRKI